MIPIGSWWHRVQQGTKLQKFERLLGLGLVAFYLKLIIELLWHEYTSLDDGTFHALSFVMNIYGYSLSIALGSAGLMMLFQIRWWPIPFVFGMLLMFLVNFYFLMWAYRLTGQIFWDDIQLFIPLIGFGFLIYRVLHRRFFI